MGDPQTLREEAGLRALAGARHAEKDDDDHGTSGEWRCDSALRAS
jgi:hypothetical protein